MNLPLPSRAALLACAVLSLAPAVPAATPWTVADGGRIRVESPQGSVLLPEVPGLEISAVAGTAGRWTAAGTVAGGGFALFTGDDAGVRPLPLPAVATAGLRREPLPLVGTDGRLAGLAWLEGATARGLAVRFSRWDGARWEPPVSVSPRRAGSQLALAASPLADGSQILAWSAFDGEDDEILWSRWDGVRWSPAARLAADNRVPDVTPTLVAVDGGALAAWARYDGAGYRVVGSRFAGGAWSSPRPLAPRGTAFPTFEPSPVTPRLVVRTALPRGWMVVEVAADGRPLRRAFAAAAATGRPVVEDLGGEVELAWPGRDLPSRRASWRPVEPEAEP